MARNDANWPTNESRERVHDLVEKAAADGLVAVVRLILLSDEAGKSRTIFCRIDLARKDDPPPITSEDFGESARVRVETMDCADFLTRLKRAEEEADPEQGREREAFVCDGAPAPGLFDTPWNEAQWVNSAEAQAAWGVAWPCIIASASLKGPSGSMTGLLEGPTTGTVDGLTGLIGKVAGFSKYHGRRDARRHSAVLLSWDYRGRIDSASVIDHRLVVDLEPPNDADLRLRGVLRARSGTSTLPAPTDGSSFEVPSDLREAQLELLRGDAVIDDAFLSVEPSPLDDVKERVLAGEKIVQPVRAVLQWFGARRRGRNVVASVRRALEARGLATVPDFEDVWIDATVQFIARTSNVEDTASPAETTPEPGHSPAPNASAPSADADSAAPPPPPPPASSGADDPGPSQPKRADPVPRIQHLAAANRPAPWVSPTTPMAEVVTRMMAERLSLLLVNNNAANCRGIVTWRTMATAYALEHAPIIASDCMDVVRVGDPAVALLDALPEIARAGYIVVKSGGIVSVVISADVIEYFQDRTAPFLLLGQIENRLRSIVAPVFTLDELRAAVDPDDSGRAIDDVNSLTFGEYVRLLETEEHWKRCRPSLDRRVAIRHLKRANDIRNEVMHFAPDDLEPDDLQLLQSLAAFLEEIADRSK